jgi:hypothetical protein
MKALAKLWTWIGNSFIPLAIGWGLYVRNGLADQPPPLGVLISRAYWGVLVTLIAGTALTWTMALYVRLAKTERALILAPPNTAFEEDGARSRIISWGTVFVFVLSVLLALTVFGIRYAESQLHKWDGAQPLQASFWDSRAKAYELGCAKQPCFAIAQRIDAAGNPIFGVNEYILYLTDGALVFLTILMLLGALFLIKQLLFSAKTFK